VHYAVRQKSVVKQNRMYRMISVTFDRACKSAFIL